MRLHLIGHRPKTIGLQFASSASRPGSFEQFSVVININMLTSAHAHGRTVDLLKWISSRKYPTSKDLGLLA